MKNLLITFICFILSFQAMLSQESSFKVMTYNIRYANDYQGEKWDERKEHVAEMIRFHKPDIFGVQEALLNQLIFLTDNFEDYTLVGVGRDDGHIEGEFSAIYISPQYTVLDNGTFWLSETPNKPTFGWDAACKRIATWAILANPEVNDTFLVMNTHLDHEGLIARKESAKLLVNKIEELSKGYPVLLMGDFNFRSESESYKYILSSNYLFDSEFVAKYKYGTRITFNGFKDNYEENGKIDYIFVTGDFDVIHHAVIGDKFNGQFPSDHMPVIVELFIK